MSILAQATKQALADSLKELLAQKPFHKITIRDITEHCGVNRMTFYYHFHDIYDLARWTFREEVAALLDGSLSASNWQAGVLSVVQELRRNRPLIVNVCRSIRREALEQYVCELVEQLLQPMLDQEIGEIPVQEEDRAFVARFYTCALVGLLLEWIDGGMKTEPEELTRQLDTVCAGGIRRAAEAFRQRQD